jgi:predicted ATPase
MENKLIDLTIKGFKSIKNLPSFKLNPITVLIGQNGAGKSNFISFFRMLSYAIQSPSNLQTYVSKSGGASHILHDGSHVTREIEASMTLKTGLGLNHYCFRLVYAAGDTLIYTDEKYRFVKNDTIDNLNWIDLGAGHREPNIVKKARDGDKTAKVIYSLIRNLVIYQFHNTSETSRMRNKWGVGEDQFLKEDGGNIAPFLNRLKRMHPNSYNKITDTIRLILPFFADFEFRPEWNNLLLSWRERGTDHIFDASQAGDGMLRVIALVSLLLQPENYLPDILILDEPELGLHPFAINTISGLIKSISKTKQVIIATQSTPFVDCFSPDEIVIVDRKDRESCFSHVDQNKLAEWLKEYSLSELWDKNVIGGRP